MNKDIVVEFRIKGPMNNRLPKVGKETPGETCLVRLSEIVCLFPIHHQIRIKPDYILQVFEEDWPRVEKIFRSEFLANRVHAI